MNFTNKFLSPERSGGERSGEGVGVGAVISLGW